MSLLAALLLAVQADPAAPRRIVLIAGPLDSHPRDTHEYERNVSLLKHCIDRSAAFRGARAEVHFGWPADPAVLDAADTILLTSGGSDRRLEDHPLHVGDRFEQLRRQMKRGCGVVFFHWATFHPVARHEDVTEWAGGYFDYESGPPPRRWRSAIETKDWTVALGDPAHPVARGVKPFTLREEFYFRIRFRDADPRLRHVLLKAPGDPLEHSVGWAVERADGGRGFGFTGGHFYANWWKDDFRRLVLNALAWTAKLEVPETGVDSDLGAPARALVLTGHNHPAHDWRATTPALVRVLEREPRLRADVVEDPAELSKRLPEADVLVLNYNNWDRPGLDAATKEALLAFLARGGGLVVVHFANGAWNPTLPAKDSDWPEFRGRLVRRAWMHPESAHDPYGTFRVALGLARHEITEGLRPFDTVDELYVKQAGEVPVEPLVLGRSVLTGKDEPLAWAYDVGPARAFQTLLGHSEESVRKAGDLIRRGAAWASKRPPLGFDPPPVPEKALERPGSWKPRRTQPTPPPKPPDEKRSQVLPPDPGIDGGRGGHWGLTGEKDWADARWNRMDIGPFMSSSLTLPTGVLARAISVRLPGGGAVFDPDAGGVRAAWTGGFLAFSPSRYGLIEMPKLDGTLHHAAPAGPLWTSPVRYRALHRHGDRVVFSSRVGGADVLESATMEDGRFVISWTIGPGATALHRTLPAGAVSVSGPATFGSGGVLTVAPRDAAVHVRAVWGGPAAAAEDLVPLTRGGPARWGAPLVAAGQVSKDGAAYVVDTVPVPFENPWKALMFLGGLDFFENGDAAVCTLHGDVWRVSGLDADLRAVSWKRHATGLFQPLGLRVVADRVHVRGRDRITRLQDLDGDGEADVYENFSDAVRTSPGGHDYVACLETDAEGRFLYVDPLGLHRVSKDGLTQETLAAGWRNPVGMSVGPDGTITVAPQEGEWTPASAICVARAGGWYGYKGPKASPERPPGYDPPLCWIPRGIDNSSGGQVWASDPRWGPLHGCLLGLSFGRSSMMLVLRETVDGMDQGGVVPLKASFASGAMRGRFSPKDGQLYVAGTKGWVSNAVRDGCLQRVRFTGAKAALPLSMNAVQGGLRLRFSDPLDREIAESGDSWTAEQWNYRYSEQYGSKEWSVLQPDQEGHDAVEISSAKLGADGKELFLSIPGLRPVMQFRLRWSLRLEGGGPFKGELAATIHRLGKR